MWWYVSFQIKTQFGLSGFNPHLYWNLQFKNMSISLVYNILFNYCSKTIFNFILIASLHVPVLLCCSSLLTCLFSIQQCCKEPLTAVVNLGSIVRSCVHLSRLLLQKIAPKIVSKQWERLSLIKLFLLTRASRFPCCFIKHSILCHWSQEISGNYKRTCPCIYIASGKFEVSVFSSRLDCQWHHVQCANIWARLWARGECVQVEDTLLKACGTRHIMSSAQELAKRVPSFQHNLAAKVTSLKAKLITNINLIYILLYML